MTKKEALDESEELWQWLMESGLGKRDYPKWKGISFYINSCPLCEFYMAEVLGQEVLSQYECGECPLECHHNTLYYSWHQAKDIDHKRRAAQKILEVIRNAKNRL